MGRDYLSLLIYLHLLSGFSHLAACQGTTNRTIDDTIGDLTTGTKPVYVPSTGGVWKDATCVGCAINPDTTKAFRGTWNAATYNRDIPEVSVQFSFTGIAVYVYFILANDQGDGITTVTQSNFTLDGKLISTFIHNPTTSLDLDYNQLVFSQTGLANQEHTLKASISGVDHDVYINFDYANYTFVNVNDDNVVSTSSTFQTATHSSGTVVIVPSQTTARRGAAISGGSIDLGAILGGAIGGVVGIMGIMTLLVFWRRRRNQKDRDRSIPTTGQLNPLLTVVNSHLDLGRESRAGSTDPFWDSDAITVLPSGKTVLLPNSSSGIAPPPVDEAGRRLSTLAARSSDLASSTSDQTNTSQAMLRQRQQDLERQMSQIQAEIRALNDEVVERRESTHKGGHSDQEREQGETAELREQTRLLQEQIRVLQQSEWSRGFTYLPPPEYSTTGGNEI